MTQFEGNRITWIFASRAKTILDYFTKLRAGETPKIPEAEISSLEYNLMESQREKLSHLRDDTRNAIASFEKSLDILMGDTLGSIRAEERVAYSTSGSWMGSKSVTFGELLLIRQFLTTKKVSEDVIGSHGPEYHGLDTPERICFYEQDYYVLSNFSSFQIKFTNRIFATSEHLYHWLKFFVDSRTDDEKTQIIKYEIQAKILEAPSAHEAFQIGQENKIYRRADWDDIKISMMELILRLKVQQHEYVRRKLLATENRELVENSWRDDFWGWGPNKDGLNMLGICWMKIRKELRENWVEIDNEAVS